jgi:hypothetical protein
LDGRNIQIETFKSKIEKLGVETSEIEEQILKVQEQVKYLEVLNT